MTISVPDTLCVDNSGNYIVSIRLRSGGLSFSGYDPSVGGSFFYREAEFDRSVPFVDSLKDFFFANECLSWGYKRLEVVCVAPTYTLVPKSYLWDDRKADLLDFGFPEGSRRCKTDTLRGQEADIVFGIEEEVYEFCSRSLINPSFRHYMAPLLTYWKRQSDTSPDRSLFALVERKRMDVACHGQGKLLFVNTFRVDQPADIVYYILYVWKQAGLDPRGDRLCLSAESTRRREIEEIARKYLRHIQPIGIPSEVYLWGADVEKAPLDVISSLVVCG